MTGWPEKYYSDIYVFDMIRRRALRTRHIKMLILDEADESRGPIFHELKPRAAGAAAASWAAATAGDAAASGDAAVPGDAAAERDATVVDLDAAAR